MSKFKAVLLDDEELCTKALEMDLVRNYPEVEIIGVFHSPGKAMEEIRQLNPDLLYLDVEMPWMNGFEFLQQCQPFSFEVIFTTAYNEFAIQAFRANAIDYLLKPVDSRLLSEATQKAVQAVRQHQQSSQIEQLIRQMTERRKLDNLCIPTREGFEFVDTADIIYCQADNNYCIIYVLGEQKKVVTRTLKEIENQLNPDQFFRTHQSYLINLDHVKAYSRVDGGMIIMSDKTKVPISRSKKDKVVERLKG